MGYDDYMVVIRAAAVAFLIVLSACSGDDGGGKTFRFEVPYSELQTFGDPADSVAETIAAVPCSTEKVDRAVIRVEERPDVWANHSFDCADLR